MKTYKSVNELTHDQFEELRSNMVVDVETSNYDPPDLWFTEGGEYTDFAVKTFYRGTSFVDGDFLCSSDSAA